MLNRPSFTISQEKNSMKTVSTEKLQAPVQFLSHCSTFAHVIIYSDVLNKRPTVLNGRTSIIAYAVSYLPFVWMFKTFYILKCIQFLFNYRSLKHVNRFNIPYFYNIYFHYMAISVLSQGLNYSVFLKIMYGSGEDFQRFNTFSPYCPRFKT